MGTTIYDLLYLSLSLLLLTSVNMSYIVSIDYREISIRAQKFTEFAAESDISLVSIASSSKLL